jgi:hypothetical protein
MPATSFRFVLIVVLCLLLHPLRCPPLVCSPLIAAETGEDQQRQEQINLLQDGRGMEDEKEARKENEHAVPRWIEECTIVN